MLNVYSNGFQGKGLYDPGSNMSAISSDALKRIENSSFIPCNGKFNTVNGEGKTLGVTFIPLKIFNITKKVILYVLDSKSCKHDFIIGLDLIPVFKLALDHELNLSQKTNTELSIHNVNLSQYDFCSKVSHLDKVKSKVLCSVLNKHSHVFAKHAFDNGTFTNDECPIPLSSNIYVNKKPYRCSLLDQQEIDNQVSQLLKYKIIEESSSHFASPVTLQFKKVGLNAKKEKKRMCIDYRELNKNIIPQSFPFPFIDDIIVNTRGRKWFSVIDINAAFWAVPIKKSDRHKTAFVTQKGHYQWNFMPFGMRNSAPRFQALLSRILRKHNLASYSINYLDDILVFSDSFEEHIAHLCTILNALFEEGFRLNFEKCRFAAPSVSYLGHIISTDSVKPMQENLKAIDAFPTPKSRKSIRQFLGKVNFYRKFIPDSATLLEPLHSLLRKHVPFCWSASCQSSFEKTKRLLASKPILAVFDPAKPIIIYSDASAIGVGAVLKQPQEDGTEKPVAYFSKKLTKAQSKGKAIYLESIAIREAIRYWRLWLIGRPFTIVTDHKPLENLNLKARTDEELGDFAHELLQFDFKVIYRPGATNSEADYLSRNPVLEPSSGASNHILPSFNFLSHDDIKTLQAGVIKSEASTLKQGIVYHKFRKRLRILLDKEAGKAITSIIHKRFGHIGSKHVLALVSKNFFFPSMTSSIREFCSNCEVCIKNKTRRIRRSAKLGFFGPATKPFQIMSLDTIGGFGNNNSTNRYLHLLVDHFSRHAYILCSKGQSAKDMITIVNSVHKDHPIGTLMTDQYSSLTSDEFQSFCSASGIRHIFSAIDSASSMGLNERLNQNLVNRMRCAKNNDANSHRKSWTTIAKQCVSQYNATPHSVTSFSPSYLLSGTPCEIIPHNLLDPPNVDKDRSSAIERTIRYHNYNKRRYDKNKSNIEFKVNDLVYVESGNKLNREKLDSIRVGPFPIIKKICNSVFEVDIGNGPRMYHANDLLHSNLS